MAGPIEEKNADGVELQVVQLPMDAGKAAPAPKTVLVGLTAAEAAAALETWGPNLLDKPEMSLVRMFFMQFVGTMPFMLELACILSVAVGDYTDFGLILLM
jgi:magnesium-transporting ATPase (P-type)